MSMPVFAQQSNLNVFSLDRSALIINKKKIQSGKKDLLPALESLKKTANDLLQQPLLTVMEKKQTPPSGDRHDYMSIALYYWPDPSKSNGLPYIRKDGQINPEVNEFKDKANIGEMCKRVEQLSLAYFFTEDAKYAQKATEQLRAWFLNSDTRMNPNFNFAQAIKGKNDGRGIGIIESRNFINVVDAAGLLQSSKAWTTKDQEGMEKWFSEFLQWLMTSKNGIDEFQTKNNHGIWYDAQKLSFALFTHKNEIAGSTLKSIKSRLEDQMDTTGFFPAEMERTISLHYSAFVMEPLFMISNMSVTMGEDLWNYSTTSGKSINKAFNVLMPYLSKEKEWTWQQIKDFDYSVYASPLLAQGIEKYGCKTCKAGFYKVYQKNPNESILHLTTLID
jgi:hypothetical protein